MRRQTHGSFLSGREVALSGLVTTLLSMVDMPCPPAPPIGRVSGARLCAVGSQSRLSAESFGDATRFVLRNGSGLMRYSVLVPLGLPSPCRDPLQFLPH